MTSTFATPAIHPTPHTFIDSDGAGDGDGDTKVESPKGNVGRLLRQPWFLFALVLMVALMGSFVHVLVGQVEHAEQLRKSSVKAGQPRAGVTAQRRVDASQAPVLPVLPVRMVSSR